MKKKLILIQLNEINFDLVKKYLKIYNFQNLKKIYKNLLITKSEKKYELLEPWIQWYSVYTGLKAKKHKVFRLGDVEKFKFNHQQIFEIIEKKGFSVGAITPMNAKNNCIDPKYFISDPWTKTKNSKNEIDQFISKTVSHFVNNNSSSKIKLKYYLNLIYIFFKFVRIRKYLTFLIIFFQSIKKKWFKSIFLDLLLHEIHLRFLKSKNPDFSSVFFNAGAHIQHHYFFNSILFSNQKKNPSWYIKKDQDALKDIFKFYDLILKDYIDLEKKYDLILCTGLTQEPNNKKEYYYRLEDHKKFLLFLNIKFKSILPRMSRDFLIEFQNEKNLNKAKIILSQLKINKKKIFGIIERRKNNLFVSLTYDDEIKKDTHINFYGQKMNLYNLFSFVALKNGKHNSKGFLYLSNSLNNLIKKKEKQEVTNIFYLIKNYFLNDSLNSKL